MILLIIAIVKFFTTKRLLMIMYFLFNTVNKDEDIVFTEYNMSFFELHLLLIEFCCVQFFQMRFW